MVEGSVKNPVVVDARDVLPGAVVYSLFTDEEKLADWRRAC